MNLEKKHYELQQYSRRDIYEILGLPDIFNEDLFTEKIVELCNDVGVMVEVRDIEAFHRLFQKQLYNQLPKKTFARFAKRRFVDDLRSKQNISSRLDFNKLRFPRDTQIYFNAKLYRYYYKLWGICKELKNSVQLKYLCESSSYIAIRRDSGTAVMKVLH